MLHKIPEFDHYYVAYLKDDPVKEPIATNYSASGVLAKAAHKTGRAKADFELREISREEYERIRRPLAIEMHIQSYLPNPAASSNIAGR
jgi:hypothetical protein